MKKKLISLCLILCLFSIYCISSSSHAAVITTKNPLPWQEVPVYEETEDGYFITTMTLMPESRSGIEPFSASKELTGKRTVQYYNTNHTLCWTYTLTGTFSVKTGVSAVCTKVTATLNNHKPSSYTIASEKHTKSGNTCTGTIIMNHNNKTITKKASITCSKTGKFS